MCKFTCTATHSEARETVTPTFKASLYLLAERGAIDITLELHDVLSRCCLCYMCYEVCEHKIDVPLTLIYAKSEIFAKGFAPKINLSWEFDVKNGNGKTLLAEHDGIWDKLAEKMGFGLARISCLFEPMSLGDMDELLKRLKVIDEAAEKIVVPCTDCLFAIKKGKELLGYSFKSEVEHLAKVLNLNWLKNLGDNMIIHPPCSRWLDMNWDGLKVLEGICGGGGGYWKFTDKPARELIRKARGQVVVLASDCYKALKRVSNNVSLVSELL